MNQNLHSRSPDGVEGTEDIQGVGGTEPEDGLAFIQYDESLGTDSSIRPLCRKAFGGSFWLRALGLWLRGGVGGGGHAKDNKKNGLEMGTGLMSWRNSKEAGVNVNRGKNW